ncbi:hypothetical protein QQX98_005380 [Neonectria punicea]|uniref:NACHT domain-containing protein n=1 Tax=Neonectria punicea TaxID=979145 RepID=A0ABR1H508_9HYPO
MSTTGELLEKAVEGLDEALTPHMKRMMDNSCRDFDSDESAIIAFTMDLDRADAKRRGRSIAMPLYSLIESVQQFSGVVETFVSVNLKIARLVLANFTTYFQAFSSILVGIRKTTLLFEDYKKLIPNSVKLQEALCEYYASIITCCTHLILIIRRPLNRNKELLEGLSNYDYGTSIQQARKKRFNGTGEWLFSTAPFLQWKADEKSATLCLNGKIGSGKTILSAAVVDHLVQHESPSSADMFHFVRYNVDISKQPETILRSLIRQNLKPESLSGEMTACLSTAAKSLYSLDTLQVLLERKLLSYPTTFIVIDALDECPAADRRILMEVLSSIMTLPSVRLKLFVSTRGSGLYRMRQQSANMYDISTHAEKSSQDIEVYIRDVIDMKVETGDLTIQDEGIIPEIRDALRDGAQGM